MQPVTIRTLRWPFAAMALLMLIPCGLPVILGTFFLLSCLLQSPAQALQNWDTMLLAVIFVGAIGSFWIGLMIVPAIKPRMIVVSEAGITYRTLLTSKHWRWDDVVGFWPLGGYKLFLDVRRHDHGAIKREFLGPYWPGDTEGVAATTSRFREAVGK